MARNLGEFDSVIDAGDLARILGVDVEFVERCIEGTDLSTMRYRRLDPDERAEVIKTAREKLTATDLPESGKDDPSRWETGWGEVLQQVRTHGFTRDSLRPQYFNYDVLRFDGDYIRVKNSGFEFDFYDVLRRVLFRKFLNQVQSVVEFGCGTGLSLVMLSEIFPDMRLEGCDWARPSQEILSIAAAELKRDIKGVRFNMLSLEGRDAVTIDPDTAVITMHALEQLGTGYGPMLAYLREQRPALCLHLEPIFELYDPYDPFDRLAIDYHRKRNYLDGYLTAVRALADDGGAEILEQRRLGFGSAFHEGYSLLVWRPSP